MMGTDLATRHQRDTAANIGTAVTQLLMTRVTCHEAACACALLQPEPGHGSEVSGLNAKYR